MAMLTIVRAMALGLALSSLLSGAQAAAFQVAGPVICAPQADEPAASNGFYFVTTRLGACAPSGASFGGRRGATSYGYFRSPPSAASPGGVAVGESEAEWLARLRSAVSANGGRLLIYVHGYFNSFGDAAARLDRLRRQSTLTGPVLLFSWPSEDCFSCYTHDEENALWTQREFDRVLALLVQEPAVTHITLVAHSMGNRVVLRGLAETERSLPALAARIGTVVLASPDVDREIVQRDNLPLLDRPGRRTIVYASRLDAALRASWKVHGYPRAGETACSALDLGTDANLRRCPLTLRAGGGIILVDTSLVRTGTGHGDFVESRAVAADLCRFLENRAAYPGRQPAAAFANMFLLGSGAIVDDGCLLFAN